MEVKIIDQRMSKAQIASNQDNNSLSEFSLSETVHFSENPSGEITGVVSSKNNEFHAYRFKLEHDIWKLRDQLRQEMELHALLQRATNKNRIEFPSSSSLPLYAQELLSNITVLEAMVSKLEQEIISLHFRLMQERNERRLTEYQLRHSSSSSNAADPIGLFNQNEISGEMDDEDANEVSEEMVRCMKNIYISLKEPSNPSKSSAQETTESSTRKCPPNSSSWRPLSESSRILRWVQMQSPRVDVQKNSDILATDPSHKVFDPYRVQGKLSWADTGRYRFATEVSSLLSVQAKQLQYASQELKRFRTLVERLSRVNPTKLRCNEKLAFWINVYNALIMHAYLAYGVPKTDLKLFSLMQKAAYTVGGHSFSAAVIEYKILKMRPPPHRPQIALLLSIVNLKIPEEQQQAAIDTREPLVCFALSCGMHSSPAVRTYTAKNVREELGEAEQDFIQAAVGVSPKGKLVVPKMLQCFAKDFVDDSNIALWISRHLPPRQAAFADRCIVRRRRWSFLGSTCNNCAVIPFDQRFRYLFLP